MRLLTSICFSIVAGFKRGFDQEPSSPNCGLNACAQPSADKLNLHIISHTHDDAGWLETVDEYYNTRVRTILNTVTTELEQNESRKFIYVETSFFERWWRSQTDSKKERVRKLIENGQFSFTLGHWSMPDEATTYYADLISNAEVGMRYLENEFGFCGKTTTGWQLDPFGHSRAVAKLYKSFGYGQG